MKVGDRVIVSIGMEDPVEGIIVNAIHEEFTQFCVRLSNGDDIWCDAHEVDLA